MRRPNSTQPPLYPAWCAAAFLIASLVAVSGHAQATEPLFCGSACEFPELWEAVDVIRAMTSSPLCAVESASDIAVARIDLDGADEADAIVQLNCAESGGFEFHVVLVNAGEFFHVGATKGTELWVARNAERGSAVLSVWRARPSDVRCQFRVEGASLIAGVCEAAELGPQPDSPFREGYVPIVAGDVIINEQPYYIPSDCPICVAGPEGSGYDRRRSPF